MENRTEQKVVYVLPDRELWYGRFTDLYIEISNSTSHLHVGVITPQLDRELRQSPQGAFCGLDWPKPWVAHSCVWFNITPVGILDSPVR